MEVLKMRKGLLIVSLAIFLISYMTAAFAQEVYKVGAILPLTGDISEYGQRCKKGMDLAVEEINKEGGMNGRRIEIIYEDSEGSAKAGVSAAQKLINIDKVKTIIGAVASSVTLAIEPITSNSDVVLISPASSSPNLTGISPFFFRTWPSDVLEASVLADFAFKKLNIKSVAIIYVNNDYGIGLKHEFKKTFDSLGGKVVSVDGYPQNNTEFRSILTKAKAKKPQAIYLAGYHKEMAFATKQIKEMKIKSQILGDADYGIEELINIANDAAEGAIYATPTYEPHKGNKAMITFARKFKEQYGKEPSIFEANAYDAVNILSIGMRRVGDNSKKIAAFISKLKNYDGASGLITFEKGDARKNITIKTIKGGKFVDLLK
jgi:branched-chain amino acid transport system substrate-binding protein